jgi:hypothetical protein
MSGVPSWARVGAKVVCINADGFRVSQPLLLGATYTIRRVREGLAKDGWVPGLELVEVTNNVNPFSRNEHGYRLTRFRPLVDDEAQERDAAMFRKLLTHNTPELVE